MIRVSMDRTSIKRQVVQKIRESRRRSHCIRSHHPITIDMLGGPDAITGPTGEHLMKKLVGKGIFTRRTRYFQIPILKGESS